MKIKEYEALTLKECLQQVRQDLGPEAVILETQKFRKGGILGWGAKEAVRILAATGVSVAEPPRKLSGTNSHAAPIPPPLPNVADEKLARLEQELRDLRSGFDAVRQAVLSQPKPGITGSAPLQGPGRFPAPPMVREAETGPAPVAPAPEPPVVMFKELYERLREADIHASHIQELLESLPDLSGWAPQARIPLAETALRDLMARRIQTGGPITLTPGKQKRVALVGPTGVGKTTTIAKLAAHFALVEKQKVGLLTMDTYRIAAVEQLKTYSQIINIPVQVTYSQAEVESALQTLAGCDLLLVDTAGRSQKHVLQLGELKTLVEAVDCETHLVLSAATKERDLLDQVNRFGAMPIDRLIFSKLDETTTYGTIYSVAAQCGIPVSYLTTGQKVPEDIEVAEGEKFAAIVMNSAMSA